MSAYSGSNEANRDEKRAVKERPISVDRRSHSVTGRVKLENMQGEKETENFESRESAAYQKKSSKRGQRKCLERKTFLSRFPGLARCDAVND